MTDREKDLTGLARELDQVQARLKELETALDLPGESSPEEDARRYRALFRDCREAMFETTAKGEIIEVNPAGLELFGRTQTEMAGLHFGELFVDPEDWPRFTGLIGKSGGVRDFETRLWAGELRSLDCLLTAVARTGKEGELRGYLGLIRNITDLNRTLARLSESEIKFRSLSEGAPDIIYTLAHDGSFNYVNPAWPKILGHRPEEVLGRYFIDFVRPADARWYMGLYKEIRDGGRTLTDVDGDLIAQDGTVRHFSMSGSPHFDRSGRIVGMVGLLKDITSRRRAEEQVLIQKAYAEQLVDGAPEAIVVLDNDGRILRLNQEFTRLFGFTLEESTGRRVNDLIVPEDLREEGLDLTRRAAEGERFEVETTRRRKDGRRVDVSILATPIQTGSGQIGVYGIYRDISGRKQAAEALQASERRFREMADLLPTAIAEIGMDLRITWTNRMGFELFEYTEEDLARGIHLTSLIHPDQLEHQAGRAARVLAGERLEPSEYLLVTKTGRTFPALVTSAPIEQGGQVVGFRSTVQDVTLYKAAEEALLVHQTWFDQLLEYAPEAIVVLDENRRIVRVNGEFTRLFGFRPEEVIGGDIDELIVPPDLYEEGTAATARTVAGEMVSLESVRRRKDGSLVNVSILGASVSAAGRKGYYAIYRDITARKRAEDALRESEQRHRIVLESAPDPVVVQDREGRVTYLNPAFTRVFGWTIEECRGRPMDNVPEEHQAETWEIAARIERGEFFSGVETRRYTKDGRLVDVSISGAVFFDAQGEIQGSVLTLQDITERKKAEAELRYVAFHDLLTGLPNRQAFYLRIEDIINQSQRRLDDATWALLFLDLDKFKHINDSLGHDVGDELLKAVAARIKGCLRRSDYLFRLGGDEFTVILTNLTRDIDVAKVARKIRSVVAGPFNIMGHEFYISASLGISVYPNDGLDVEVLVKNADMAMYAAKEEGDGYRFFTEEMNRKALERLHLEGSLRNAIQRGEFVLHYQPLVDTGRRVIGAEALLRWRHPELGVVPPAKFIGLAEETGAIIPIGEWVLRTACTQARRWQERWDRRLYIAVNLSARQFRDPALVEMVEETLRNTGLDPGSLKLEVTESSVMENPEETIAKMVALRAKGVRFSIDDFGTGYSSLSYLKRFPIDTLKIDRSFVTDSMSNVSDQEIIKTIISMARNLSIETVAEGVETQEQQDFLCGQGCSLMQGFFFGRPVPGEEFEKWLEAKATGPPA
ncbi:MAG: PAS domain S-box protein [Thermodesulfobacteriota bacterium]